MPNPVQAGCDLVGHSVRFSELGLLSATLVATSSPFDLTAVKTPVPETCVVLVRLSSGTGTLTVDTTSDGTYSSAEQTLSLTGTNFFCLLVDTASATPYLNVRIATSANCIVDRLAVLSLAKLTSGENWMNVREGYMAVVDSKTGDGVGTFVITTAV